MRLGLTAVTRAQLFRKFQGLEIDECPFANLPEAKGGRWGQGLTKARMAECVWLKPASSGSGVPGMDGRERITFGIPTFSLREGQGGQRGRPRMNRRAPFFVGDAI